MTLSGTVSDSDDVAEDAASYLDAISLRIFRYVSAFHFLISAGRPEPRSDPQVGLQQLERYAGDQREIEVREAAVGDDDVVGLVGGIIDPDEPKFLAGFSIVQSDLRQLLAARHGSIPNLKKFPQLGQLVSGTVEDLVEEYGSVSHAWDCLVGCKQRLALPATDEFALGTWHVACVSEAERLIRETVLLALTRLGRRIFKDVAVQCFRQLGVELRLEDLLETSSTAEAVSQSLLNAMRQGSGRTILATRVFCEQLEIPLFPDGPGMQPGLLDLLKWIRTDPNGAEVSQCLAVFETLLGWRRQIIHASVLRDEVSVTRPSIELFGPRAKDELNILAQFLAAFGLRFALDVTAYVLPAIKSHCDGEGLDRVRIREWKLAAELRVLHLDMLKAEEWGLAWAAAEPVARIGDAERQDMPRLNAFYAQGKLDPRYLEDVEHSLRQFQPHSPKGRYELIKRSILGYWDGIEELLDEVLESRDVSLKELQTWPALTPLRSSSAFQEWFRRRTIW